MTMRNFPSRPIGWLAITTGAVAIFAVVSLTFMFAVGGSFGLLNDLANGAEAILSALLAWRLLQATGGLATGLRRHGWRDIWPRRPP